MKKGQVPDFGDRFWVYAMYDARTDQFAEIGKPYDTKPGFYLVVGPQWKGEKPAGIEAVVRSSTALANAIPRVLMDDTAQDRKAFQPVINQIVAYPLKDFDGKMKTKDWTSRPRFRVRNQAAAKRLGRTGKILRSAPDGARNRGPIAGRRSPLRSIPCGAVRRRERSRDHAGADEAAAEPEKCRQSVPGVEAQRPPGRQWLESLRQQCPIRRRLLQSHRHGEVDMFDNKPTETQYIYTDAVRPGLRSTATTPMKSRLRPDRSRRSTASGRSLSTMHTTSSIPTN